MNKRAVISGIKAGSLELVKANPVIAALIEGSKGYREFIEQEQEKEFVRKVNEKLANNEEMFSDPWLLTSDGKILCQKIVSLGLDPSLADKTDYFVNCLCNASMNVPQMMKLDFLEILKLIPKPALLVLAAEQELNSERGEWHSPQVLNHQLHEKLRGKMNPALIDSCVNQLYAYGVFNSQIYDEDIRGLQTASGGFEQGTPAFTPLTRKFIEFISERNELKKE
ncbi:hypothetical protein LLG95_14780 [bacterium]|nr:hypothetical protein [bacterium]